MTTKYSSPLEAHRLTASLLDFRRTLEKESGESIECLEVNAAMLLSDVCKFMGLDDDQVDIVVGTEAIIHVSTVLDSKVQLRS